MWKKPWGYKEGFICGAGLFVTGLLLQWSVGGIRWGLFAWPVNIIVLVLFLLLLAGMHGLRKRVYCFGWLSHYTAAVSSLVCVAAITVIMGLVRQVPSTHRLFENAFFWAVCVTLCLAGCCLRDDYSPCRYPLQCA